MNDLTVIYYTSNREKPAFEARIRRSLWHNCRKYRVPLISVSQKPLDFGTNICVGDVGASSQNAYRQLWLGCLAATTRFVATAESDMLYQPEYFRFRPTSDDTFYLAKPLWVMFVKRGKGRVFVSKPRGSESAMFANRELLIARIEEILRPLEYWGQKSANGEGWDYLLDKRFVKRDRFFANVLSFKTDQQLHSKTPHIVWSKTRYLEPWGHTSELLQKYIP